MFWSKRWEIFRYLSLSPFNSTTWQDDESKFSSLSKSPTCPGSNSRGCREICPCLKWTEFGMVSAAKGTAGFEERLGSWKYCKLGTSRFVYIWSIISSLRHSCHHFVKGFLQRWCCRKRFRGCLCGFSLLLIYCHIRNWYCVHNGVICILDLGMLSNSSKGGFNKVDLTCAWYWYHRWKFQIYSFSTSLF